MERVHLLRKGVRWKYQPRFGGTVGGGDGEEGEQGSRSCAESHEVQGPFSSSLFSYAKLTIVLVQSHCKLPYNTESQRLDLADFYDFRPSYPDYVSRKQRKALASGKAASTDEWEDLEGDGETADEEGLEVVYEDLSDSDDEELPESEITYGDSSYELVLPSGARIGNKAHKHIFKQNLAPHLGQNPFKPSAHSSPHTAYRPSPHSATLLSLVPAMHKDKSHSRPLYESGLIPAKGAGVGGNGDVIRARNKGEAKEANKSVRNFTELKARARQEFIRGVKANSQEHVSRFVVVCEIGFADECLFFQYRDHLLQ